MQSWNLNAQRELLPDLALMVGYFGSKGTHLRISRNLNQPVNGVRPFPRLSSSSPELPGASLGNITQVEGSGNSSYNALWATLTRRYARGLQLNASYTGRLHPFRQPPELGKKLIEPLAGRPAPGAAARPL